MAPAKPTVDIRVEQWEDRTEWPLVVVAVLFLLGYAWPILDPALAGGCRFACRMVDITAWLVFAADYVVRIALARPRGHYFLHHLPDLAFVALPALRPLRLVRLLLLLRVFNRQMTDSLRGRVATYVGGATVILILCAGLAVLDAERGRQGANIETFGDALWWAVSTVSTVGYGDHYPVTVEGRLVAVGLMVGGVALIGIVTGSFATWLVDRVRATEAIEQAATRRDVQDLTAKLDELMAQVVRLQRGDPLP